MAATRAPISEVGASEDASPAADPADPKVCERALFHDTPCAVMVIDRLGRILEMNAPARATLRVNGDPVRHTIEETLPRDVARERLALVARALDERRPITVEGMLRGVMRRCTYRPLEGRDAVLAVSFPVMLNQRPHTGEGGPGVRAAHDDLGALATLTEREIEVMALIGEGLSTHAIARRLHRSEKTIEWHRASLGHKLGVANRVELARLALRAGLCALPLELAVA